MGLGGADAGCSSLYFETHQRVRTGFLLHTWGSDCVQVASSQVASSQVAWPFSSRVLLVVVTAMAARGKIMRQTISMECPPGPGTNGRSSWTALGAPDGQLCLSCFCVLSP